MNKPCVLALLITLAFPTVALAGIDSRFVEVGTEEREALERERIRLQEEYELAAKEAAQREETAQSEELAKQAQQISEDQREARLKKAQELRDAEIEAANSKFEETLANMSDEEIEKCGFWCKVWRFITFPFRMIGKLF